MKLSIVFAGAAACVACASAAPLPPTAALPRAAAQGTAVRSASTPRARVSYSDAPTLFAAAPGRQIAYRSVGQGPPLLLCNRFRGTVDDWDPAFIDRLAEQHTVVTFDTSGLGRSGGPPPTSIAVMAGDVADLADALHYPTVSLVGWSLGGFVAQTALARFPGRVTSLILIGTGPAGATDFPAEPVFLERAHKPVNDLEDETILFFEPISEASRKAAAASHERIASRKSDRSVPVPPALWPGLHAAGGEFRADKLGVLDTLKRTSIPILVIMGDHDIVFPMGSWYALTRQLPTARLVVFPRAGHGPQHEYIEESVAAIETFVRTNQQRPD